jgi:hypothetical protein
LSYLSCVSRFIDTGFCRKQIQAITNYFVTRRLQ